MREPKAAASDSMKPDKKFKTILETTKTLSGSPVSLFPFVPTFSPSTSETKSRILTDRLPREGHALVVGTKKPKQTENATEG